MAFELGQGSRDNTLDVARLAHIGLDCDDVCLRREFAHVIANLAQLIACRATSESPPAPSRANRSAISRPSPCDAPVMRMFLPANRSIVQRSMRKRLHQATSSLRKEVNREFARL